LDSVEEGQIVFAFGSPWASDNSVTWRDQFNRAAVPADDPMIYLQTDASD